MTLELTGIHHLTAITAKAGQNRRFYVETLGIRLVKKTVNQDDTSAYHLFYGAADAGHEAVHVFAMGAGGPAAELHVAVDPEAGAAVQGAGGVHHVAFRTPDLAQLHAWTDRLSTLGLQTSGEVERYYFRSLYFREPAGILFEIATDGPGFAVDESIDSLGETLSLPPFLEPRRAAIEARLRPI